jgi:hypothetical protein
MRRREFLATVAGAVISSKAAAQPRRVLLAHGVLGFKKFGNVDYFQGVRSCFTNWEFIEPQVDPVGTIFERAGQLESAILSCVPRNEIVAEDELMALDTLALRNPLLAAMVESCFFCNLEMA